MTFGLFDCSFEQFHCPLESVNSPTLTSLTFGDIAQILTLLQADLFEKIERLMWDNVAGLSPTAREELCALIWMGRGDDDQAAWQSMVREARGIDPCYVFEKISNVHYITTGLQRLGLAEPFSRFVHRMAEAPLSGIAA